jgi:diguanylate cyclase
MTRTRAGVTVSILGAGVLAYPAIPAGSPRTIWYAAVGLALVLAAYLGLRSRRPVRSTSWALVLAGYAGWLVGDLLAVVERDVFHVTTYPVPSDAVQFGAFGLVAAGFLLMARDRRGARDRTTLLDAAIIATGVGVVALVFVVEPIAADTSIGAFAKTVCAAYPIADVFLLAIVLRVWMTPAARSVAVSLLTGSMALTFAGDALWHLSMVATGGYAAWVVTEMLWLGAYALLAFAAWAPSMRHLAETLPEPEVTGSMTRRLVLLAAGLALPAVALIADGLLHPEISWLTVGSVSLVMTGLVLARMVGLIRMVQVQSVQLAALARSDGLTGAPNRRTWDHELSRACQASRDTGTPLSIALIDLDYFKRYNDTRGHQAGDLLLREAVAAWTDALAPGELLARYGGEEFAVLLPGLTPGQATERMDTLRSLTPHEQTISVGIALWEPATEPGAAVAAADAALYQAKRCGRDRVVLSSVVSNDRLPQPTIVVQPIVDLTTGEIVAREALSRFDGLDPAQVFREAHAAGTGITLEAAAVRAALPHRRSDALLTVNVSIEALLSKQLRDTLQGNLEGLVLEITEQSSSQDWPQLETVIAELRTRGCRIAIDDWGHGYSNIDRLIRLKPDIVKLDISLVQNLASREHRAVVHAIMAWARDLGALVCAEGVETPLQRAELVGLGVHLGQGYHFGRPGAPALQPAEPQVAAALPSINPTG